MWYVIHLVSLWKSHSILAIKEFHIRKGFHVQILDVCIFKCLTFLHCAFPNVLLRCPVQLLQLWNGMKLMEEPKMQSLKCHQSCSSEHTYQNGNSHEIKLDCFMWEILNNLWHHTFCHSRFISSSIHCPNAIVTSRLVFLKCLYLRFLLVGIPHISAHRPFNGSILMKSSSSEIAPTLNSGFRNIARMRKCQVSIGFANFNNNS